MKKTTTAVAGAGIGAALMYYFDPESGNARRALLRDRTASARGKLQEGMQATQRDVRQRAYGYRASRVAEAEPPTDDVLVERVRARLGRALPMAGALHVTANQGAVTLAGPVLAEDLPLVIDAVLDVPGVRDLQNRLELHADPGNIPALQGARRTGRRSGFTGGSWSPSQRLSTGAGGAVAAIYGFARGGLVGAVVGLAGTALMARAASNLELSRLTGIKAGRRAVNVHKIIRINAPVEKVFRAWADCEDYPQFMSHVRSVRRLGAGEAGALASGDQGARWRWTVRGPLGMEFEFDTVTTAYEENRFVGWRTEPGALIQHEGRVRFEGNVDGSTTVEVRMSYNPVAGTLGHVVAKMFGADPKSEMNDDLARMKTFLETGTRPADAATAPQATGKPAVSPATPPRTH